MRMVQPVGVAMVLRLPLSHVVTPVMRYVLADTASIQQVPEHGACSAEMSSTMH